jgi:hypothetical protein
VVRSAKITPWAGVAGIAGVAAAQDRDDYVLRLQKLSVFFLLSCSLSSSHFKIVLEYLINRVFQFFRKYSVDV